jgi:hypothetical protein
MSEYESWEEPGWMDNRDRLQTVEVYSCYANPRIIAGTPSLGNIPSKPGELLQLTFLGKWREWNIYRAIWKGSFGERCFMWKGEMDRWTTGRIFYAEPMDHTGCFRGTGRDGFSVQEGRELFVQLCTPFLSIPPKNSMTDMEFDMVYNWALLCARLRVPRIVFKIMTLYLLEH